MSALGPFRVLYSGSAKDLVRELLSRALSLGIGDRVMRCLREVERNLESNPHVWGDPIRHKDHARISIYRRVMDDLCVEYGVHDTEPYVWLSRIEPVLGHPLCKPDARNDLR